MTPEVLMIVHGVGEERSVQCRHDLAKQTADDAV